MEEDYFEVCESRGINLLVGAIFLAMGIGIFITRNYESGRNGYSFILLYSLVLGLAVIFFVNGIRKSSILVVDKTGIFLRGAKICDWENFINAYIGQEFPNVTATSGGLSDKTYIIVFYFDQQKSINYKYQIRMSNSQINQKSKLSKLLNNFLVSRYQKKYIQSEGRAVIRIRF